MIHKLDSVLFFNYMCKQIVFFEILFDLMFDKTLRKHSNIENSVHLLV